MNLHPRVQRCHCSNNTQVSSHPLARLTREHHGASQGRCQNPMPHWLPSRISLDYKLCRNVRSSTFPFAAPRTVGNHRLSLESMRRKIASCSSKSFSSFATSALTCSREASGTGWPGIGMLRETPAAFYEGIAQTQLWARGAKRIHTTPGNIFFKWSAAHSALGFPPWRQSSKSKRGCRTGFENETREESRSVMFRTPQP